MYVCKYEIRDLVVEVFRYRFWLVDSGLEIKIERVVFLSFSKFSFGCSDLFYYIRYF